MPPNLAVNSSAVARLREPTAFSEPCWASGKPAANCLAIEPVARIPQLSDLVIAPSLLARKGRERPPPYTESMKSRKRRLWILLGAAVPVATLGVVLLGHDEAPEMHWKFLGEQRPEYSWIQETGWLSEGGLIGQSTIPNYDVYMRQGPAAVRRGESYRFRADYPKLLAEVREEVAAKGGIEDKSFTAENKGRLCYFHHSEDEWQIYFGLHDSRSKPDASHPYPLLTVKTAIGRKENIFGRFRRWLRSISH